MAIQPKLTTIAACRVARIDRDRFNEHVAADRFPCAPDTIAGRARLFDPDDMVALWLFRELLDDGVARERAGHIACQVARCARQNPQAEAVAYVETFVGSKAAVVADEVSHHSKWGEVTFGGSDIRKVTTFNIAKTRKLIAHYTAEEQSIIGPDD